MFHGNPTWGNLSPAGRYAYADTFAEALDGFKRKRTDVVFKMPNDGEAGSLPCVFCGGTLAEPALAVSRQDGRNITENPASTTVDKHSTWTYRASDKRVGNGMHYVCSWSALMVRIFVAHDAGRL